MIRRIAKAAALGATSIALTLAMASPASAGAVTVGCDNNNPSNWGSAVGYVEAAGAGTYDAGAWQTCGVLGVRGYYTHIGGASWTSWKYSAYGAGSVTIYTKNMTRAQHSTSVQRLSWFSYR